MYYGVKSISWNILHIVDFSNMHPCNDFGMWTVNKESEGCIILHSDFLKMSYEFNIKMQCVAPLLQGHVKNFMIPLVYSVQKSILTLGKEAIILGCDIIMVSIRYPWKRLVIPRILIPNNNFIRYLSTTKVTGIWTCGGPIPRMTSKGVSLKSMHATLGKEATILECDIIMGKCLISMEAFGNSPCFNT